MVMPTLSLFGLPEYIKVQKVVFLIRNILKRENAEGKFWIREMADIRGTDLKSATLEFDSYDEAVIAEKILDGFVYFVGDVEYPLTAKIDSRSRRRRSPSPDYRMRARERYHYDRYEDRDRYRERSPLTHETSKLDLEIELLRKRRLIIEEERRLLLERKKLELVKEFGPNALKEFKFADDRNRRSVSPPRMREREYRPRRSPPWQAPQPARPRPYRAPIREVKLPQFTMPCRVLLLEMQEVISKHSPGNETQLLLKLIRSSLRRRIAVLLEGKPILPGAKIVTMYRSRYPADMDEELVKKHMKEVKACHLKKSPDPKSETVKNEDKQEENNKTKPDSDSAVDNEITETEPTNDELDNPEPAQEIEEQDNKVETYSMGSSEALTLHDKNDEDWAQGEHGWDGVEMEMTAAEENECNQVNAM